MVMIYFCYLKIVKYLFNMIIDIVECYELVKLIIRVNVNF